MQPYPQMHPRPLPHPHQQQQYEYQEQQQNSRVVPIWQKNQKRKKMRQQIFGQHYNYNYKRPNQNKMYRVQENRNTEIERANRILLEKIQTIFKRSMGRKRSRERTQVISQTTNQTSNLTQIQGVQFGRINHQTIGKEKVRNGKDNRKSLVDKIGVKKELELARIQLQKQQRDTQFKKNSQQTLNRNHIKLQQMQEQLINKRKRFHTDSSNPAPKKDPSSHKTPRSPVQPSQSPISSLKPNPESSQAYSLVTPHPQKIILFKLSPYILNSVSYCLQAYVEGTTYILSAVSHPSTPVQFKQLITMPYSHYQELYRYKLQEDHQNIVKYLQVGDKGLLRVQGFDSRYMDIFQYGEIVVTGEGTNGGESKGEKQQKRRRNVNSKMDEISSIDQNQVVVHYNGDDSLDTITYTNSQVNPNQPTIRKTNLSKQQKIPQKKSNKNLISDTYSFQNSYNKEQKQQKREAGKSQKKQIFTMTENLLINQQNDEKDGNEDQIGNNHSHVSSYGRASRMIKQPKLSSNLINVQIQPVSHHGSRTGEHLNTNTNANMEKTNKKQQKSFLSDLDEPTKPKIAKQLKKQEQLILEQLEKDSKNYKSKNKQRNNKGYSDQDIISDHM